MKQLILIISTAIIVSACDTADAPDCLKTSGELVETIITLPGFTSLQINQEFDITLEQSPSQEVVLITGENLIDEIKFDVTDSKLTISDENSCDWVRDYNFPKVTIRHPGLSQIRQNGGGSIISTDTLIINTLHLISENSTGLFDLRFQCDKLVITNNDLSNYYLSGITNQLEVGFFSGDGRFEGAQLLATHVNVFHRGSNDIIVNVSEILTGRILSTGNIIYVGNTPSTIDISDENRGELINGKN